MLLVYFVKEMIVANVLVAIQVIRSNERLRPAVFSVPLDLRSDRAIALLANMITLTPGSLALDVAADRSELYVHFMHAPNPEDVVRRIKQGFERRIKEILC